MTSFTAAKSSSNGVTSSPLPRWLAKHVNVGFNSDDVTALIDSIDSSQLSQTPSNAQLPAELLLLVLEQVPIDFILDWRLVCRGFRDAIDTRVLYHHLQRTQLVGLMETGEFSTTARLTVEQHDRLRLVQAKFQRVTTEPVRRLRPSGAIWNNTHAVFRIEDKWFEDFHHIIGVDVGEEESLWKLSATWGSYVSELQLQYGERGFGSLRWCIKLDHAVLDLSLPLDRTRNAFECRVHLDKRTVSVRWKDMLFGFLKTEAALRRMLDKKKDDPCTYSPAEDCLREVRRQRLHASLDYDSKKDRHIKWSLRLLPSLFGKPQPNHSSTLLQVENSAIDTLLLLRREAAMTAKQIAYLHQLNEDRQTMDKEIDELGKNFDDFKSLLRPTVQFSLGASLLPEDSIPRDPIAWPDDLRATIEGRVNKWKSQRAVMRKMSALVTSSNEALTVPEDSFDDLESDI